MIIVNLYVLFFVYVEKYSLKCNFLNKAKPYAKS